MSNNKKMFNAWMLEPQKIILHSWGQPLRCLWYFKSKVTQTVWRSAQMFIFFKDFLLRKDTYSYYMEGNAPIYIFNFRKSPVLSNIHFPVPSSVVEKSNQQFWAKFISFLYFLTKLFFNIFKQSLHGNLNGWMGLPRITLHLAAKATAT